MKEKIKDSGKNIQSLKYTRSINEKIWKVGEFVMGPKHKLTDELKY